MKPLDPQGLERAAEAYCTFGQVGHLRSAALNHEHLRAVIEAYLTVSQDHAPPTCAGLERAVAVERLGAFARWIELQGLAGKLSGKKVSVVLDWASIYADLHTILQPPPPPSLDPAVVDLMKAAQAAIDVLHPDICDTFEQHEVMTLLEAALHRLQAGGALASTHSDSGQAPAEPNTSLDLAVVGELLKALEPYLFTEINAPDDEEVEIPVNIGDLRRINAAVHRLQAGGEG